MRTRRGTLPPQTDLRVVYHADGLKAALRMARKHRLAPEAATTQADAFNLVRWLELLAERERERRVEAWRRGEP